MKHLKILNRKEIKRVLKILKGQFGEFSFEDYAFFINNDKKIFLLSKKFADLDEGKIRINNLGLYFCKEEKDGLRLTIEGAQLINPKRNVVELSKQQVNSWVRGEDVEIDNSEVYGYVVVKHGKDIFGCGKFKEGRVLNSVPKARRVIGVLSGDKEGLRTVKCGR